MNTDAVDWIKDKVNAIIAAWIQNVFVIRFHCIHTGHLRRKLKSWYNAIMRCWWCSFGLMLVEGKMCGRLRADGWQNRFSSCRDVSRASVGEASVKHSCEDELALTVAFVLTLHTPHTHKWMNKKMCAEMICGNIPPHLHWCVQYCTRSAGNKEMGVHGHFITPSIQMQSALTSTLSSTNTLTLLVSLQVRKKVSPQNIYTCILLTHLFHNSWNGTPQFKMLPIGGNSQKSSVVQTRFRSEAFMTSVRRGISLTIFSWTY